MDVALYDQGEYALYRQAKAEGVTFDCQAPLLRRLSALLVIHQQEIGLEFLRAEKHIALARAEVAQCHRRRRLRRQERQPDGRGGHPVTDGWRRLGMLQLGQNHLGDNDLSKEDGQYIDLPDENQVRQERSIGDHAPLDAQPSGGIPILCQVLKRIVERYLVGGEEGVDVKARGEPQESPDALFPQHAGAVAFQCHALQNMARDILTPLGLQLLDHIIR